MLGLHQRPLGAAELNAVRRREARLRQLRHMLHTALRVRGPCSRLAGEVSVQYQVNPSPSPNPNPNPKPKPNPNPNPNPNPKSNEQADGGRTIQQGDGEYDVQPVG